MVRRGVCVCAHDDVRGRVCVGVVSTSSTTATLRGKKDPGTSWAPTTNDSPPRTSWRSSIPALETKGLGSTRNPSVKQRKYEELCGRKRRPFFWGGCYSSFQQGRRSLQEPRNLPVELGKFAAAWHKIRNSLRICAHEALTCINSYATSLHAIFLRSRSIFTWSCSTP